MKIIQKYQNPSNPLPEFDIRKPEKSIGGFRRGLDGKLYFLTPEEIQQYDSISEEERAEMANSDLYKKVQSDISNRKSEEKEKRKELESIKELARSKVNSLAHTEWSDFDADANLKELDKINKNYELPKFKYFSKEDANSIFQSEFKDYVYSTGSKAFLGSSIMLAPGLNPFLVDLGVSLGTGKAAQLAADAATKTISKGKMDQFVDIYGDPEVKRNGEERSGFGKRAVNTARFLLSPEMAGGIGASVGLRRGVMKFMPKDAAKNYFSKLEKSYRTMQHPITTALDKASFNSTKNKILKLPDFSRLNGQTQNLATTMGTNNNLWGVAAVEDVARHAAEVKGLNDVSKGKQSAWTLFANPLLPFNTVHSIAATRQGLRTVGITPGIHAASLNNGQFNQNPINLLKAHSIGSYRGYNFEEPLNIFSMDPTTGKVNMGYNYMSKTKPNDAEGIFRVMAHSGYYGMPKPGEQVGNNIYLGTARDLGMTDSIVNKQASSSGLENTHVIVSKSQAKKLERLGGAAAVLKNKNTAVVAPGINEPLVKVRGEGPELMVSRGNGKPAAVVTNPNRKYLKVNSADNFNALTILPNGETTKGVYAVTGDLQQGASTVGTWLGDKLGMFGPVAKKLTSGIEGAVLDIQQIRDLGQLDIQGNTFSFSPGRYKVTPSGKVEFNSAVAPYIRESFPGTMTSAGQDQFFGERELSLKELGVSQRAINKLAKKLGLSPDTLEATLNLGYNNPEIKKLGITTEQAYKELGIDPSKIGQTKGLLKSKDWGIESGLTDGEGRSPAKAISEELTKILPEKEFRSKEYALHADDPDWTYIDKDLLTGDEDFDAETIASAVNYKKEQKKRSKRRRALNNYYSKRTIQKFEPNQEF